MRSEASTHFPKAVVLGGLAIWMTVAVLNNLTDRGTNIAHLETMLTMGLLVEDPVFGNGLEWRALPPGLASALLWFVSVAQVVVAVALWRATLAYASAIRGRCAASKAISRANVGLGLFLALWLVFLCGGLWFGYWMKQGPIQGVHLTLILVSLGAIILVNQNQAPSQANTDAFGE
jgi:predicted small integral membrane protein